MLLDVDAVSYTYRRLPFRPARPPALRDVSLASDVGVTALLGPNGAGKTTLMRLITGSLSPDSGSISVDGAPVRRRSGQPRRRLGWLPQEPVRVAGFSLYDYVAYAAWLRGVPRGELAGAVDHALETVDLADRRAHPLGSLSGGMFRRAAIATAIVHCPAILLLDEPTVGLDPAQRASFRELTRVLGETICVLVSTHLVADVEAMCDRVLVLDRGRIRFAGTVEEFRSEARGAEPDAVPTLEAAYLELMEAR